MFHVKHRNGKALTGANLGHDVAERVRRFLDRKRVSVHPDLFGRLERFATTLNIWGQRTNLTAEPDDLSQIAYHIIDSLMPLILASQSQLLRKSFQPTAEVLDLGTGAGFPGLVLAAACDARLTLLEGRRRRANFLRVAAAEMTLHNVEIVTNSREVSFGRFAVVTARAFAKPQALYPFAAEALKDGGIAVLYAGPHQPLEEQAALATGLTTAESIIYQLPRDGVAFEGRLIIRRKLQPVC